MFRPGSPRAPLFVCALALLLIAATAPFRGAVPEQTRALWVTRTTLTSPDSIRQMVAARPGRRIQHAARAGAWTW
jgi:hypothetical protein